MPSTCWPTAPCLAHELLQFAARLGSDVPFFASARPLALGLGPRRAPAPAAALPAAPGLLVTPADGVATAEAYGWVDAARQSAGRRGAVALDLDALSTLGRHRPDGRQRFRVAGLRARFPAIRAAFEALAGTRPLVCRMSGSGSALFAIYRSARDREDARMMLGHKHGRVDAVETLASPPAPPAAE